MIAAGMTSGILPELQWRLRPWCEHGKLKPCVLDCWDIMAKSATDMMRATIFRSGPMHHDAVCPLVILLMLALLAPDAILVGQARAHDALHEGFEDEDLTLWLPRDLESDDSWFDDSIVREGDQSLAIRVNESNHACGRTCQRNEIRLNTDLRLPFGADAWYAFGFRIDGELERRGSTSWVVGQWKQENGRSPFLAQRFDNGVFHITVQDNNCRVMVAAANRDPAALAGRTGPPPRRFESFLAEPWYYACDTYITLEWGPEPLLPNPHGAWVGMLYHVVGGRDGQGLVEVWANGVFTVRATGSIGHDDAAGPTQYFRFGIYRNAMPGLPSPISTASVVALGVRMSDGGARNE